MVGPDPSKQSRACVRTHDRDCFASLAMTVVGASRSVDAPLLSLPVGRTHVAAQHLADR
jgi:hypothetical protein